MEFDILCDFDGTITRRDVTDFLLERLARPGWQELEEAWTKGEIGSRECMAGQVALLDASAAEIDAVLAEVRIDPGFPAFLKAARGLGADLTVVSDGIDYAIRRVLARHGVVGLPVIANRLVATGPRRYRLEHPFADAACRVAGGTCKCAVARNRPDRASVLIGDGRSDFCLSAVADLVLAKDALADHCASRHIPHLVFGDFTQATALLPEIAAKLGARPGLRAPEAA